MFFVKTRIDDNTILTTEITDENVFTHCPDCGSEAEVLLPSFQHVYVDRVVQVSDSSGGGRRFEIHLKDRGRKKK